MVDSVFIINYLSSLFTCPPMCLSTYIYLLVLFCCCSVSKLCPTLCHPMDCSTPNFSVLHRFPEFVQTHVHWVNDAIQPSHPLASPSPPAFNVSQHKGFPMSQFFTSGSQSVWSSAASTAVLPMNIQGWFPLGLTGLISFLAKGLKSLLQHHRLKVSVLWCSAFFMVQLSHLYMTTAKTIA